MSLFYICLIVRVLLAYYAMEYNELILYATTIIGVSFWAIYLFKLRPTAMESSETGKKVWLNDYRPLHGTLYLLFAYSYYNEYTQAYLILFLDVAIGFMVWTDHRAGQTR